MRKLDSMQLEILKTLYEPLNNTKLKLVLENYHAENFNSKKAKKISKKVFNAETSKFDANVLVAEDNIINQKLIKRTLEDLGLKISIASNGLEAFQKRKDGNFDLIFMDIQMPFLDGMEATKEILEYEEEYNQPHVPILALTANALKGDRERFLEAGLDEYTTKPLVRSEIISLLNHFLADHIVDEEAKREEEVQGDIFISNETEKFLAQEDTLSIDENEAIFEEVDEMQENTIDILLAKKTSFEARLFRVILDSLGYSYKSVDTLEEFENEIEKNSHKVILFDREFKDLKLEKFVPFVKEHNSSKAIESKLILISDASAEDSAEDARYVDEIIKNVVTKDQLKLLIEKFI
jgi:CheY-like chemotaxis protein